MIYQSYNFIDSYSNASGNRRDTMVLGELGKVIRENPDAVKSALIDADVKLPREVNRKGLVRAIMSNKRNTRMIKNLSALIVASASFDGGYEFLGRKKSGDNNVDAEQKKGLFKAIGSFFRNRKERKAQRQQDKLENGTEKEGLFKRIGSFFNRNKEEISEVGSSLYDSLQSRNAQQTMTSNVNNRYQTDSSNNVKQAGFFQKNKTAIIVLGVVGVAVAGYFIMKNRE